MELKVPPPVYMALFLLLMWLFEDMMSFLSWENMVFQGLGILLMTVGFLFDGWSFLGFVKSKTTINPLKPESANNLVTDRLYRFTRNPMYLGMVLILAGWAFYLGSLLSLVFLPVFIKIMTKFQILPEERALEEIFGEQFLRYKSQVGRWL